MSLKWKAPKDPADEAWYAVECGVFLDGDTLATTVFTPPAGLEKIAESHTNTDALVKWGGGVVGVYPVILDITTVGDQAFQRTVILVVKEL